MCADGTLLRTVLLNQGMESLYKKLKEETKQAKQKYEELKEQLKKYEELKEQLEQYEGPEKIKDLKNKK